jgi:cell division protein ZapA (FtsZ GTPase activity inhibitor)
MSLHVFNIDLVGPTFTIQTDESLDYMQSLIMRLRERLGSLKESTHVSDPLRLAVLLNVTLMDELQRTRERSLEGGVALDASEEEEFAAITARLIADLDRSLPSKDAEEVPAGTVLATSPSDRIG